MILSIRVVLPFVDPRASGPRVLKKGAEAQGLDFDQGAAQNSPLKSGS
jgi:hypothetical protein